MSKKIRIGTYIDLATCRNEGYMTVLVDRSDLDGDLDPEKVFKFGQTWPRWQNGGRFQKYNTRGATANNLWKIYQDHKKDIDSFCGDPDRAFPKSVYDLLRLSDDLEAYGGWVISNAY